MSVPEGSRHASQTGHGAFAHAVRGFYGPGSQMWRINREAVLLGAGPAALLLQIAHPLVAEGVAAHSDFRVDPFRRLRRTLRTTLDLVFGDGPSAEAAVRRLNGVHATVRGPTRDPGSIEATGASAYRALDPRLLLWVQATLIVTSVRAYRAWVGPVTASEQERFWQEARGVGVRLGIPFSVSPPDWPSLEAWFEEMIAPGGPVVVTDLARSLAPDILRPPVRFVPPPIVELLALPGLSLLPGRIREGFGIDRSPARDRTAHWLARAVRTWTRAVPADWRAMPQARAAQRRVAKERAGVHRHPVGRSSS